MSRPRHTADLLLDSERRPPEGQGKGPWLRGELTRLAKAMNPGDLYPSDRVLADRFEVARMTIRGQIDELVGQGLLERVPGRGTFVRQPGAVLGQRLQSFSDEMRARGLRPDSAVISLRRVPATARDQQLLGVGSSEKVIVLVRVRFADDVPMALERIRLPAARFVGLSRGQVEHRSLYELLAAEYDAVAQTAEQTITVVWPSAHDLALLELPADSPALQVERVTRDNMGRVLENGRSIYRADRYEVQMRVTS